jgi:tetratricopeptide (TPR) repeat protein
MRLAAAILALAALPASAQAPAEARERCLNPDPAVKIEGCTAVIRSGRESPANLAVAYGNRAAGYDAQGDPLRAVADATQAIALDPAYADGYNERAWAYHELGRDGEGLADAEKAVSLAPGDPFGLETRAEIYEKLGQRGRAIADYRAALALAPGLKPAQDGLERLLRGGR